MVNKQTKLCWNDYVTISRVQKKLKPDFKDKRKQNENIDKAEVTLGWDLKEFTGVKRVQKNFLR